MTISYEDFSKIELKAGTIRSAERVAGSDKLLRLEVDLGEEIRQIIAGIGKKYDPAALPGRQITIVANLEPRALMGLESRGMLLAAGAPEGPVILAPTETVPPGSAIK